MRMIVLALASTQMATATPNSAYRHFHPHEFQPNFKLQFPSIDTDDNGFIDGFEQELGTNPTKVNSTLDGVADGVEQPRNRITKFSAGPMLPEEFQ